MSWVAFTILLCLAVLATFLVGGWVFDYHNPNTDAAGRGYAEVYIAVVDFIAFLALGVVLVLCGMRDSFTLPWGILAVVIFLTGTYIAALTTITALCGRPLRYDFAHVVSDRTGISDRVPGHHVLHGCTTRGAADRRRIIRAAGGRPGPGRVRAARRRGECDRIMREAYNEQVVTDRKRADQVSAAIDTPLEQFRILKRLRISTAKRCVRR